MTFDVVLLHPPFSIRRTSLFDKIRSRQKPSLLGEFAEVPMGLFSMASLLEDEGFKTRIFNLALEQALNPSLKTESLLKSLEARVYAIDLHWFTHSLGALQVAEICKNHHANSTVVLGGFTSTFYDLEIIRSYPFVDAIARGESEHVLSEFVKTVCSNRKIEGLKGITCRSGKVPKRNDASPPPSLEGLKFARLELMENWDKQLKCCTRGYEENRRPSFWLTIARGCCNECIYCGGARSCYQLLTGRHQPAVRPVTEISEDIAALAEKGVKIVKLNHDPEMLGRRFWSPLLDSIKNLGVEMSVYWESYKIPSRSFIEKATETFIDLNVAVSPESVSEHVRISAGRLFTDDQMLKAIKFLNKNEVMTDVYFLIGLPGETADSANSIVDFARKVYENKHILVQPPIPYTIDPHCPMALNPEKYGVKLLFNSFEDYRKACSLEKWEEWIGHETRNLSQAEISELTANIRKSVMALPQEGAPAKIAFEYESGKSPPAKDN